MKSIMLVLLFAGSAFAQINPPLLDEELYSGRIRFKEVSDKMIVFVPTLFSQSFFCNEQKNVCTFQIYNQLDSTEEALIQKLHLDGISTQSLRPDLFKQFVQVDSEGLTGDITNLQSSFITMKNFALLEHAYGNAIFKSTTKASALLEQYENEGLGSFHAKYTLTGVVKDFSIRIKTDELINLLELTIGMHRIRFGVLRELVSANLTSFNIIGYLPDDAAVIIADRIKQRFMITGGTGTIILDYKKLQDFKNEKLRTWAVAESVGVATETCSIELPIKKNSQMKQKCEVSHED